jgi:lipoprotein-anchoring transpeptidase ErfK/SrfK
MASTEGDDRAGAQAIRPAAARRDAGRAGESAGRAGALSLSGNRDSLYRIHGTNAPQTIGQAMSSGCIRMLNEEVIDLHDRVRIGTKVIVI